ncbi:MAG TPA: energy transducer TonB [Stellaceae bacterium]|jgi:hypothetical protein|nr:energy transducer TonB [Stellaceae bacterium]
MSVAVIERGLSPDSDVPERMPKGIAFSAILHLGCLVLIALGLPVLFHRPPLEDMPIAVELVTIAPETHATRPNPFKPKAEAKPEFAPAPPAPKPEPKPEPVQPAAEPPPSAAAPPPAPQPPAPKPEAMAPPPPPPPPPKPVEAPAPPPPPPEKVKPEPPRPPVAAPKPEPKKVNPAAFAALMKNLDSKPDKKADPAAFDSLLKNLTRQQTAEAEDAPPQPRRPTAAAAASSQPKAPLGAQLTASEMDLLRQQLYQCWNVPAGVRDAKDLVIEIRVSVGPDGTARQAAIIDQSRLGDPVFRAAAESARRTFFNPQCTPLRVPAGKYETWKDLVVDFSPKDIL